MVDDGLPPGDILILAQRGVIGTPIYETLHGHNVPVRSYYAEAELDAEEAQRRFALLKLFVNREDRVALRWLVGYPGHRFNAAGYRRVREHCEQHAVSPWQALAQLANGALNIPYTGNIVTAFNEVELNVLEGLPSLADVIDHMLPVGDDTIRDLRDLATRVLAEVGEGDREEWLFQLMQAITRPEVPSEIMTFGL